MASQLQLFESKLAKGLFALTILVTFLSDNYLLTVHHVQFYPKCHLES